MPVPCPAVQWPSVLDECGPAEDPSILLTGRGRIGNAAVQVVAIRIDPTLRLVPDYRDEVAAGRYRANGLDNVLEAVLEELEYVAAELSEVLGETRSSLVELADRPYRVWLIPASFEP